MNGMSFGPTARRGIAALLMAASLSGTPASAQTVVAPDQIQPTRSDTPPLGANAANQPNGQVAPPSAISSGVQVMSPATPGVAGEAGPGRQTTTIPSLNALSGDRDKGVPGR